jgi:hypothetical protein
MAHVSRLFAVLTLILGIVLGGVIGLVVGRQTADKSVAVEAPSPVIPEDSNSTIAIGGGNSVITEGQCSKAQALHMWTVLVAGAVAGDGHGCTQHCHCCSRCCLEQGSQCTPGTGTSP